VCRWLVHVCDTTHLYVCHDLFMCVTKFIIIEWRDSFICVTWLIHMSVVAICVTWLIHMCDVTLHMCDVTHSYVWHDSFIWVSWLIHTSDMTHRYVQMLLTLRSNCKVDSFNVWHDSFICVTWLIHMCDMTHSDVWHDSFICVTWHYIRDMTHSCVTWLIHMCRCCLRCAQIGM